MMLEHQDCAKSAGTCSLQQIMLFEHAIRGCDATSRVFNIGKGLALKLIRSNNHFITHAGIFLQ